ncbi:tripartite tricarboxylate transporter permease [Halomonas sp. HP20-15]|uniref:tripartite tricarboxylate transporter permease n=1 Tax=Halomonas sp. HP20-15 TaxID=3085901 RepID=UPI0029816537|nr:tripartite tricarboxylate transporter permease [Halomonas sp. HP20-15]MDW5377392.1 tripartite tricarboxylate transporter permease [Halomonas sp. HP20-15]
MFEAALEALSIVLDPSRLVFMLLGVSVGLIVGILPGLGGVVGMSLLLPFVYGMDTYAAIAMLIGMAAVIATADTFPSVLIGVPGSAGSQATVLDGYPLAQQGRAGLALSAAFSASLIGGLIGALVLFLILPVARPVILSFKSPHLFMLTVLGLCVVGLLAGKYPFRGILATLFGILIAMLGSAPASVTFRFVGDSTYLMDGVPLAILAMGLFAVPEIIDLLAENRAVSKVKTLSEGWKSGIKATFTHRWLVLRSSALGVAVGAIPGLGGSVVDWLSYGQAMHTTKDKSRFGQGEIRGVIAPESSNNAKEGGALIPTLLFGIPGSGTTAVLLGGLILLGIQPGPSMLTSNLPVTLTVVWTLALANVVGALACFLLSRPIARLSMIPASKFAPFLIIVMMVGAYQNTRQWGDLVAFIVIGLVGWLFKTYDWPRAPVLIGFVLAPSIERYLTISASRYGWSWLADPIVIVIGLVSIAILFAGARVKGKSQTREAS